MTRRLKDVVKTKMIRTQGWKNENVENLTTNINRRVDVTNVHAVIRYNVIK